MPSPFVYCRFPTRRLMLGNLSLGGQTPIRIQSMTTTDTMDTRATLEQSIALFDAGAELVRITAPGPRDAENLGRIKSELIRRGYEQPLVADIHFSPKAAMIALEHVEKVRINPGNFVDRKRFELREYTDQEYEEELEALKESFLPLVRRAKELGRVLRIGSNHGSLSDRIMNRYGDTPLGMIESALEFIRFAREEEYHDIVVSMKSSNPQVMVEAYRLLSLYFQEHGYDYPLHLGVTEAGGQRDGRMKSAVGIGALLMDGIGDTIRVSLTEDPVQEIYAAKDMLRSMGQNMQGKEASQRWTPNWSRQFSFHENKCPENPKAVSFPKQINGSFRAKEGAKERGEASPLPIFEDPRKLYPVFIRVEEVEQKEEGGPSKKGSLLSVRGLSQAEWQRKLQPLKTKGCDALWCSFLPEEAFVRAARTLGLPWVQDLEGIKMEKGMKEKELLELPIHDQAAAISLGLSLEQLKEAGTTFKVIQSRLSENKQSLFLHCISKPQEVQACVESLLKLGLDKEKNLVLSLSIENEKGDFSSCKEEGESELAFGYRFLYARKEGFSGEKNLFPPILLRASYASYEDALMKSSIYFGSLLLDGIGDALFLELRDMNAEESLQFQLDLLQATRLRLSKTEYISCPSCGRTLFDLEETTARIRKRTGHLKGLKIAVMGCIVNGPGEMADADFGYVGAGPGKVHLYRKKKLVKANVPAREADEELVRLIQENNAWSQAPKEKVNKELSLK